MAERLILEWDDALDFYKDKAKKDFNIFENLKVGEIFISFYGNNDGSFLQMKIGHEDSYTNTVILSESFILYPEGNVEPEKYAYTPVFSKLTCSSIDTTESFDIYSLDRGECFKSTKRHAVFLVVADDYCVSLNSGAVYPLKNFESETFHKLISPKLTVLVER